MARWSRNHGRPCLVAQGRWAAAIACLPSFLAAPWVLAQPTLGHTEPKGATDVAAAVSPPEGAYTTVVVASRNAELLWETVVPVEVIQRHEIELSGARDAAELLAEVSGVEIVPSLDSSGVRLQGLDPKHVLILVDGERAVGRVDGAIDLRRFRAADIQRVEILKGPGSALYGADALGGVINIVTRGGTKDLLVNATAQVGEGSLLDLTSSVSGGLSDATVVLSGGYRERDAYDLDPRDVATTGSSLRGGNVAVRGTLEVGEHTYATRLEYQQYRRAGIDTNAAGAVFDRTNLTELATVTAQPKWRVGDAAVLRSTLLYSLFRDQYGLDQRGAAALDQYQDTLEHLGQVGMQVSHAISAAHELTYGAEGFYHHLVSNRLHGAQANRQRLGLYVQDEWALSRTPRLTLVPGARLDVDSQFGVAPSPKLALRYDPHPTVALRLSYGAGFRAPDFKELYLTFENPSVGYRVDGDPALRPETSHGVNSSIQYTHSNTIELAVSGHFTRVANLIDVAIEGGDETMRYVYGNVANAHTAGGEARLRWRIVRGLVADVGYTYLHTRDLERGRPLSGRAQHRGTAGLRYRFRPWDMSVSTRVAAVGSRVFFVDRDGDGVDEQRSASPYALVEARIAKKFDTLVEVFVSVDNLFDAGHAELLPLQPRRISAGLTARYW